MISQRIVGVSVGAIVLSVVFGAVAVALFKPQPYAVSGTGQVAWRINAATGEVSVCRAAGIERSPICSPWGAVPLQDMRSSKMSASEFDKLLEEATK